MDTPLSFKEGYLLFPPQGVLGQLKKSWHRKYCQLFKSSKHGIERLEIFDSEEEVCKNTCIRIITLENCVKIKQDAQKHQPNVFTIVTKTGDHHFASFTEKDMLEWIDAFQSIAFKDDCSRQTIEEDNDLYCSSGEGVFSVKLVASEASTRCGLEPGPYTLVVTPAAIQLRDNQDHRLLATWPYCYIRRYGYREGKFTFEAGRKCTTGEGDFHLEHSNRQEIFRCISSKMKSMRKMLSGDGTPSPGILCGDNQFQAALSMEARSRSPLPPSPTSTTQLMEMDFSHSSSKPLLLSDIQPLVIANAPHLMPKPKPAKPPRKNIYPSDQLKKHQEDAIIRTDPEKYRVLQNLDMPKSPPVVPNVEHNSTFDYDKVEIRTEAWRKQGIDQVVHTERLFGTGDTDDDTGDYANTTLERFNNTKIPKRSEGSKILRTQLSNKSAGSEYYDTLQHFGSSSKLNSNPGYKHIPSPLTSVSSSSQPVAKASFVDPFISVNEYDVITDNMQACRLADDSHQGYGMIRKKSYKSKDKTDSQVNHTPNHKVYNDLEYAVVQKPKRV